MRSIAAVCLVATGFAAGCGGSEDRPDLAAQPPPTETSADPAPTTQVTDGATQSVTAVRVPSRVAAAERARIAEQARAPMPSVQRWNSMLDSCVGPSGKADDPGAPCTREAWEQLFKQTYAVHYELLALSDRVGSGACHRALTSAIDAVHGFLAGATP